MLSPRHPAAALTVAAVSLALALAAVSFSACDTGSSANDADADTDASGDTDANAEPDASAADSGAMGDVADTTQDEELGPGNDLGCAPACDGKDCGDDGCGSTCGSCPSNQTCDEAGQCTVLTGAEDGSCDHPFVVGALPFSATTSTLTAGDELSLTGASCAAGGSVLWNANTGQAAADHVWSLTAEDAGLYTVSVESDFDALVYVLGDCHDPAATCLDVSDSSNPEVLAVALEAGETVHLVVDGSSKHSVPRGVYTLTVSEPCDAACGDKVCGSDACGLSCGTCPVGELCNDSGHCTDAQTEPGNTCAVPFVVTELPFVFEGDTSKASDEMSVPADACGQHGNTGQGNHDQVHTFVAPESGVYMATLDSDLSAALYVASDCLDVAGTCLAISPQGSGSYTVAAPFEAQAGVAYTLVVEVGWSGIGGAYTLTIGLPCAPSCEGKMCGDDGCGRPICGECEAGDLCTDAGSCVPSAAAPGNTCAAPIPIGSVPFVGEGDTTNATNAMWRSPGACGSPFGGGESAPEDVYLFTPSESGVYTVSVASTFGVSLYVATECGDIDNSCVATPFLYGRELLFSAEAGTSYTIVVDGMQNDYEYGPYTLTVSAPCTPSCGDAVCGDAGCGASCGECLDHQRCNESGQCSAAETLLGNYCGNELVVGELPFVGFGDTTMATNDFEVPESDCNVDIWQVLGAMSNDQVWRFTPEVAGSYTVSVNGSTSTGNFHPVAFVVDDCEAAAALEATCYGVDRYEWDPIPITVDLAAGETVFIVVDAHDTVEGVSIWNHVGAYVLTVF